MDNQEFNKVLASAELFEAPGERTGAWNRQLLGDPMKAKTLLGWNPTKTSFSELVKIMVEHDIWFVRKLYLKTQISE